MNLHEYQPVTLLDFPGKVATILFISGCPLRCPYCHNPELVLMDKDKDENKLTEFLQYIKKRKNRQIAISSRPLFKVKKPSVSSLLEFD